MTEEFDRKAHWEKIYNKREFEQVSWYQKVPQTSLKAISDSGISKNAKIIDIGGGDCYLVDHLLEEGYTDITVLDISEKAISKAKERLGQKALLVKWIVSDVTEFEPTEEYDLWHDRAAFHFLNDDNEVGKYVEIVSKAMSDEGQLVIATFSEEGPTKCSGIDIRQYSENHINEVFEKNFKKLGCRKIDHKTPADAVQNFLICSFSKK